MGNGEWFPPPHNLTRKRENREKILLYYLNFVFFASFALKWGWGVVDSQFPIPNSPFPNDNI